MCLCDLKAEELGHSDNNVVFYAKWKKCMTPNLTKLEICVCWQSMSVCMYVCVRVCGRRLVWD